MTKLKAFLCALVLLCASPVYATNYYVSTSGNNANNGLTTGTAYRTIAYAVSSSSAVAAGDVINVLAGTYTEYVQIGKNGGNSTPITLQPNGYGTGTVATVILTTGGMLGNIMGISNCNWTIQGLEIKDSTGGAGIYWDQNDSCAASTNRFINNVIHNTDSGDNASCIFLQRNKGTYIITGNTLYDCDGTNAGNNTGIVVFGHINTGNPGVINYQIQNNTIYNEGVGIKIKHPFATDETVTVDISYNILHDLNAKSGIGVAGGTFTSGKTTRIHHNLLYDSTTTPAINVGDDFDELGVEIDHNTTYNMQNGIQICLADGCSNTPKSGSINAHDNLFMSVARAATDGYAIWTENTTSTPFTTSDYGCYWNVGNGSATDIFNWGGFGGGSAETLTQWRLHSLDAHSVRGNPGFVNAATDDFHLTTSSPCYNLRGDSKYAGAYETGTETLGAGGTGGGGGGGTPASVPGRVRFAMLEFIFPMLGTVLLARRR